MNNIKIIKKSLVLVLFLSLTTAFGQIGINVETPSANLDVNGDVRLRKLNNPTGFNRQVLANQDGVLGYSDLGEDNYAVKDILFKVMPVTVSSTASEASVWKGPSQGAVELGLDIVVPIEPFSSTAIAIEYNIPITSTIASGYIGVTLVKFENGVMTELEEGSRKFTLYNTPLHMGNMRYITMPVSGKATDIVYNNTNQTKYITYSSKGYIEIGAGTTYFGNPLQNSDNFGTGILVIQVYQKKL
ncbi:hypothetical protein [Myroides sp. DW712]|uniref:hypothetical protein n=1 Tax=Myroides sp. DW712 TaxID=3389800 RepID=UPI00397C92F1